MYKQGSDGCHVSFAYHLSGVHIGMLAFDVSNDGGFTWQELWKRTGHQSTDWQKAYISLANFDEGATLQFRFRGSRGNGVFGDIAIDQIRLHGSVYEGFPDTQLFVDADGDGFGAPSTGRYSCVTVPPTGYVFNALDCDDTDPAVQSKCQKFLTNTLDENCNIATVDDDTILPLNRSTRYHLQRGNACYTSTDRSSLHPYRFMVRRPRQSQRCDSREMISRLLFL
ncbi:MAG: hypothetical protein R2795_10515 [Saprospiraceae bacterium]